MTDKKDSKDNTELSENELKAPSLGLSNTGSIPVLFKLNKEELGPSLFSVIEAERLKKINKMMNQKIIKMSKQLDMRKNGIMFLNSSKLTDEDEKLFLPVKHLYTQTIMFLYQDRTKEGYLQKIEPLYEKYISEIDKCKTFKMSTLIFGVYRELFFSTFCYPLVSKQNILDISTVLKENKVDRIMEPFCGTGFIGFLFQTHGGFKIEASDVNMNVPYVWMRFSKKDSMQMDYKTSKNSAMLISWTELGSDIGLQCLELFQGNILVYFGADDITDNKKTKKYIKKNYEVILKVNLFHYPQLKSDYCRVYKKKSNTGTAAAV